MKKKKTVFHRNSGPEWNWTERRRLYEQNKMYNEWQTNK